MTTVTGTMRTDKPQRYARQLFSHWANRGTVTQVDGESVQHWMTGQVIRLRPTDAELVVTIEVPEGADAARFAQTVKEHLERLGRQDELEVVWDL